MIPHVSVLLEESIALFDGVHLETFYEGTVGAGGHAEAILTAHPEIKTYVAIDQDEEALALAKERLKPWNEKVVFIRDNFENVDQHLEQVGLETVDGMFFDLGVSSMQLDQDTRGFSFMKDGPLDMRMDQRNPLTAEAVVNEYSEDELGDLFRDLGEEPRWRRAASAVARARRRKPIKTTGELAEILKEELKVGPRGKKIHPATLIFQAIRIHVNRELHVVQEGIRKAVKLLAKDGRIGVISFHSFEDRLVKNIFRDFVKKKANKFRQEAQEAYTHALKILTKKPIVPSMDEIVKNPRSRSAKLRGAEKE